MRHKRIIKMISLLLLLFGTISCDIYYHDDLPPFEASPALLKEGPIEAGKSFEISMYFHTSYYLKDINVKIVIPPEVVVESFPPEVLKKMSQDDITMMKSLAWKGKIKSRSGNKRVFSLWLISNTNWTKWSRPIEINISLYARGAGINPPWPDGYYSKTIRWSHEGYYDSGWSR